MLRARRSWAHHEGEPRFWEVFLSAAGVIAAFAAGYLTTPVRIGTAVVLSVLGASAIWRYRVWRHRQKHHSLKGFERASVLGIIAVTAVLVASDIAWSGARHVVPPGLSAVAANSTAASSSAVPVQAGAPPAGSKPVFSYFAFPSGSYQDIDVRIADKGYVRQVFTARSGVISSVVVIASRQPTPDTNFSVDDIGQVRLQLEEVDPTDPARVVSYVPVALADSGATPAAGGAVEEAGPNHENTTFDLDPVKVTKGKLYAFVVTNLCGSWMAFSLHSVGISGSPLFMYGYNSHSYVDERTNRALTGYVCDITNC